jgi:uridine phosphorylase
MEVNHLLDAHMDGHHLYNFGLMLTERELKKFKGIKYVCMQGSGIRTFVLSKLLAEHLSEINEVYFTPMNLFTSSRFTAYRVGDILLVSHGMGSTSILTLLHNLTKLMYYAGNLEVEYIRLGTCGGLGIEPGSIIVTDTAYMPDLTPGFKMWALDQEIIYPTTMDQELNARILKAQPKNEEAGIYVGNTMTCDDFYLGQARFDGAIRPKYTPEDRMQYFKKLRELNILNIEMEGTALAGFCARAKIPACMISVTLINRLETDQITATEELLQAYSYRLQNIIFNYLKPSLCNFDIT